MAEHFSSAIWISYRLVLLVLEAALWALEAKLPLLTVPVLTAVARWILLAAVAVILTLLILYIFYSSNLSSSMQC